MRTHWITALGMVAVLSGCNGYRVKIVRPEALPGVVAAAQKDNRRYVPAPDLDGSPTWVSTGFQSVEVRGPRGEEGEVFRVPLDARFEGKDLVVQTWNQKSRYTPKDTSEVRLRYEQAAWARSTGALVLAAGCLSTVGGGSLALASATGDSAAAVERRQVGVGLFLGGFALQLFGIILLSAGPDAEPPVWPAR